MTGGMNYLERLLRLLREHGLRALIDLHAVPSGGTDWDAYAGVWAAGVDGFWGHLVVSVVRSQLPQLSGLSCRSCPVSVASA